MGAKTRAGITEVTATQADLDEVEFAPDDLFLEIAALEAERWSETLERLADE